MTKKKYSQPKHQKDASFGDTSEEEFNAVNTQGKSCPHVARGIHFGRVKKSIKSSQSISTCNGCSTENQDVEELPEVWLCLQCGYRGCGRTSENKHGLQHFKTLHSDCHSLVLSTTSGSVWCYDCDDEINLQSSRVLKQCVEFVMKMVPSTSDKSNFQGVNKFVTQQNLQNSVIKEETSVQNTEENGPVEKIKKPAKNNKELSQKSNIEVSQKIPIKGLRNLGNTCFFNAVMQNLNQTPLLYLELKNTCTPSHSWEVPELVFTNNEIVESDNANTIKLSLPRQFPMTNSLLNFLEQMSTVSSAKIDVVNPSSLFGEISRKCPQFRHFQQQDSHELLRQLLDGVRQEEIKRQKKAILRHFDLENVSPENVDEETKKQIKAYGCYASHTIVEKIFGGLLISTVLCEECKTSSQVFEPFMDLSLPLFEEKQQENNEQLYGMLDGGKQAHMKPLRNKRSDWDSDENTQGEYVLSKPKSDVAKPSKHQEKKRKYMAKKEKKRAKTIARTRKSSLNEHCDNSVSNELNETQDPDKEENTMNNEDPNTVCQEEVWEIESLPAVDEKNPVSDTTNKVGGPSAILSCDTEENIQGEGEHSEKNVERNIFENTELSVNEDSDNSISNQLSEAVEETFEEGDSIDCEEPSNVDHEDEEVWEVKELFASDEENSLEHIRSSSPIVEHCMESNQNFGRSLDSEGLQVPVNDESPVSCSQTAREEDAFIFLNEVKHEENEVNELQKQDDLIESEAVDSPVVILNQKFDEGIVTANQNGEAEVADDVPNPDDSLQNLTEDFNNCLKISDSNQSVIDDRIQALSMQVKDVRIRRDSDRQENLLNSSESADDCESLKTNCTSPKSSVEDSCSVDNGDNWSHSVSEQQTKDWILKTLTTLKPRHHVSPLECSVNSCLSHFTKPELLTGSNKFRCENCTGLKIKKTGNKKDVVYSNASKQMLIFSPPAVLTLHLKRFQQVGMSLRKVNRFVEFPLILDLAPFCCSAGLILPHMSTVEDEILYSLFGIVEHSGRLTSGHYTAYVKVNKRTVNRTFECQLPLAQCDLEQLLHKFSGARKDLSQNPSEQIKEDCQWFYISDSHVKEVSEAQVLKCQAYLLFYERIK